MGKKSPNLVTLAAPNEKKSPKGRHVEASVCLTTTYPQQTNQI
jgi:hypothetical protein